MRIKSLEYLSFTDEQLSVFRILFSLFFLFFNGMPLHDEISRLPQEFLTYPSVALLYGSFPPLAFFQFMDIAMATAVVFTLIGFYTRAAAILVFAFSVISYSFAFSIGGSSSLFLIPFFFLILSFSGWGSHYSLDSIYRNPRNVWPNHFVVLLLALTVTFSFFLSGCMKIMGGWLNPDSQAIFWYWHLNFSLDHRISIINPGNFNINSALFWEISDYVIVILEIAPFLFLWHKKTLGWSLLLFGFFQLLVYFSLNISFSIFPVMYCLFFMDTDDSSLLKRLSHKLCILFQRKNTALIIGSSVIVLILYLSLYLYSDRDAWKDDFPLMFIAGLFLSYALYVYLFLEFLFKKKL